MAPIGLVLLPVIPVMIVVDALSIWILWSSKKALLTTDPEAPESTINVIGILLTVAAQHKAVNLVWFPKVLAIVSVSFGRLKPFDNSAHTAGAIWINCPKVMLA